MGSMCKSARWEQDDCPRNSELEGSKQEKERSSGALYLLLTSHVRPRKASEAKVSLGLDPLSPEWRSFLNF